MSEPDFEKIRTENDTKMLADLPAIRRGERLDALISFAKAYLGMFAITDDCHDPASRVHMLANDELARAVLEGIAAALHADYPSPEQIGESIMKEQPYASGYVVLAGLEQLVKRDPQAFTDIPDRLLKAGLCFHYANPCAQPPRWLNQLLDERIDLVSEALLEMWLGMINLGTDYLPGYNQLYVDKAYRPLVAVTVLPLLQAWQDCRDKTMRELLHLALRFADRRQLLDLAEQQLQAEESMSVKRRVYWRATAFMLANDRHAQELSDYVGRSKERALRLLDFVYAAMQPGEGAQVELEPMALARLIRMIAPKFTPRQDAHGTLDEIERKVVWLFNTFEKQQGRATQDAMHWLQGVRVMRGTLRYFNALPAGMQAMSDSRTR
jgi:hypothetical protein